jgi:hypothetical protein
MILEEIASALFIHTLRHRVASTTILPGVQNVIRAFHHCSMLACSAFLLTAHTLFVLLFQSLRDLESAR